LLVQLEILKLRVKPNYTMQVCVTPTIQITQVTVHYPNTYKFKAIGIH